MKLVNKIGEQIKKAGTNPHALSLKAGMSYRSVLRLVNSEELPMHTRIETLVRIAKELDVPVGELFEVKSGSEPS